MRLWATVDAAWETWHSLFSNTAPMYGAGPSRDPLRQVPRPARPRRLRVEHQGGQARLGRDRHRRGAIPRCFKFGLVNRVVYDYSEKGALTSIEGSLNRPWGGPTGTSFFVHDVAQDFSTAMRGLAQLETARTGAFRALARLRARRGVHHGLGAWGVNPHRASRIHAGA